jgi:hypothetical protein
MAGSCPTVLVSDLALATIAARFYIDWPESLLNVSLDTKSQLAYGMLHPE